ncbi:RagB/SusD family nutrient uptake outer membrane protein [Mucilaginibacter sabulilitoris]|uniref:RagB/SusD family nutrient uptake outer membrane protein n=1 Tax=Mucilaginibacter sabulilitoris TaxID=1173583 RepID=A0ABZ0TPR0_9SPHI|nr:RagB/SusD family nutrient uptake outer membrane protein [Mucilaginibacter sabulilitoris]WPU94869.1 RagB/SusD family nutrient uptake outer membrane protein [Mucilaginibacter sabulilitoris]
MKKYIKYLLVVALLIATGGCKKNLDLQNKSAYTYDTYFTSDAAINQAVIASYATLLHTGLWAREWYYIFDLLGYDAKNAQPLQGDLLALAQYNFAPNQPQLDAMWSSLYRLIMRSNVVINRAQAWAPANTSEQTNQKQYIAEAKFLRAYAYFNLVNLYGRVPLRKEYIPLPTPAEVNLPRAAVADIWAFIEQDLKDAETDLPLSYAATSFGRATRGAAVALLGKSYLYEKKWADAVTELSKLTQSPYTYALAPVYNNLFDDPNQNSPALNPETIFQVMNQAWTDWGIGNQYAAFGGQETWGGKATHSARAQEYGFNDWNNTYITTTAVKAFTYTNPQTNTTYVDPRAAYTFYGDAASGGETQYCQQCSTGPVAFPYATAGYKYLKYEYYNKVATYGGPQSGINGQVIRYADVLLMLAEAYIQQGNTGSQPLTLINQVRSRPSVNAPLYSSLGGQSDAMTILMRERQLELTGEQSRYFDLIRWGIARQTINSERQIEDGTQPFQDKNILLPIPLSEKNSNPNVSNDISSDWN